MIRFVIRWITALFGLSMLFSFANETGLTAIASEASGYDIPTTFTLPYTEKIVSASGVTFKTPQQLALEALQDEVKAQGLDSTAAQEAIAKAKQAGVSAEEIASAYQKEIGQTGQKAKAAVTSVGSKKTYRAALVDAKKLTVKGRAPKTGYTRAQFGSAWTDNVTVKYGKNGCDTRNDILGRDLTAKTFKANTNNCVVLTGRLADKYTGKTINFARGPQSSKVQIDHLIPLSDAWQKGAQSWSAETRRNFANDPVNLMASDGPTNGAKGDKDAATWLPPNKSFRCEYIAKQVAVKKKYGVWATQAEKAAMVNILSKCAA